MPLTTLANDIFCQIGHIAGVTNRIKELREKCDMTLEDVAAIAGTTAQQIWRLENNKRRITPEWMRKIAPAFGCDPLDLLENPDKRASVVPIIGYINSDESISEGHLSDSDLPPNQKARATAAIEVQDDSLWPVYRRGDLIYFERDQSIDPSELIGRECVVYTEDGRAYVKRVMPGATPGKYRLASFKARDLEDVTIVAAHPVTWVRRA